MSKNSKKMRSDIRVINEGLWFNSEIVYEDRGEDSQHWRELAHLLREVGYWGGNPDILRGRHHAEFLDGFPDLVTYSSWLIWMYA